MRIYSFMSAFSGDWHPWLIFIHALKHFSPLHFLSSSRKKANAPLQCCYCSVAQLCLTVCDPMDCSMPGLPVHHQLPEFTQTDVHWVSDAIQPSHPLLSCPQSLPASKTFPMSQFFTSGGWSIGASALASVLPMNIQDWFPLGWTGLLFLQSKGLSRVFSNTTVQQFK